jgi:hypothetical protein
MSKLDFMTWDQFRKHRTLKARIDELITSEAFQHRGHPEHREMVQKINSLYGRIAPPENDKD